jgi:transposase
LFSINASRVKEEIRERLVRYQRECYQVLADALLYQELSADLPDDTAQSVAILHQIRENALAIAKVAEEQIKVMARLDKAAVYVAGHERRIRALEQRLSPMAMLTDEQAADVQQAVMALANTLSEYDPTKNQYQAVFAELKRRFRTSSYKTIRQDNYQTVLNFLDAWHAAVQGDTSDD